MNLSIPSCVKAAAVIYAFMICSLELALVHAAPGPVTAVERDADGLTLNLRAGLLKLQVFSPRVIRVVYAKGDTFPTTESLAVIARPASTSWTVFESPKDVTLATEELEAHVNRASGAVRFSDPSGTPILEETADGSKSLVPTEVGEIHTLRSKDAFVLQPGEAYYGLGQHRDGQMNYRGERVRLQQENGKVAVPVLLSSRGYGLLWDNPAVTEVDFGAGEEEIIPSTQLLDERGQPGGLTACYFRGDSFGKPIATNVVSQVDFDWSTAPPAGVPHDHYSIRWTGFVEAIQDGVYTLAATADDGVRLWIDDQELINDWNARAAQTFTAKVHMDAGSRHRIRMEYFQDTGPAVVRLAWRLPTNGHEMTWTSEAAEAVDYYFMYGPDLDRVIREYRNLTGAAPMFGRWAWGFWQCKERYQSQQELLDVVARYRQMHVPLDGIIQDWQYWTPHPWGSHMFDANRYPNPAQLMHDLHTNHVHALISVWPKFDIDSSNATELREAGGVYPDVIPYVFPSGKGQWYDPFNPVARRIYWRQMSEQIFAKGFDGWWLDASEPELGGKWGEFRDFKTAAGPGATLYNAYPLLHTTGVYEGQRAETSAKRVFILTRSAYAGQQRNAAVTWSGDIHGTWDVFAKQIPAGLNFVASGIPYWNTDIGGFFGGDPADPGYAELFTRWFQFGAFCPMFRVHGTGKPKEMWRFDTSTQRILIEYDRLRYRLMPYIYSVSWKVTREGYTMMRPLVMDFRTDPNVHGIKDQFMFGPALMVCPVTEAGATNRSVYLPAGAVWTDFWTGKTYAGGRTVATASPITTLPLFVRNGAILPYGPDIQYAMQSADPIELRVYRGADAAFTLYEDEGDNYGYEKGVYAVIPIEWSEADQTMKIGERQGEFPGMLKERTFRIVWVSLDHGVDVADTVPPDSVVSYSGTAVVVSAAE